MSLTGGIKGAPSDADWLHRVRRNVSDGLTAVLRPPRVPAKPLWRERSHIFVVCVAGFAIAAAMMAVDGPVANAMRQAPDWLIETFSAVTDFGKSGWFLWPAAVLLAAIAVLGSRTTEHISRLVLAMVAVRLGFFFAAIAVPGLFVALLKRMIGRARPFVGSNPDPNLFVPFIWRADYTSMPSGHATTAFAAATACSLLWPRLRVPMAIYALVIAASRVVPDAHFVSDVIAGAVMGIAGALFVRDWFAARRLGFVVRPDGRVSTLPGPSFVRIKRVARRLLGP
jgi:membrane-associated phospholipid phosphatase